MKKLKLETSRVSKEEVNANNVYSLFNSYIIAFFIHNQYSYLIKAGGKSVNDLPAPL